MTSEEYIKDIIVNGSREEKIALYNFDENDDSATIAKKFNLFVVGNFHRYYEQKPAPFHAEMIAHYIASYIGEENYLNIGFRGCAKTTLKKLFDVYVLLNDQRKKQRRYIKVMTKDLVNSRQIVTDVYNLIVEVAPLYGDVFEKEGKKKREETMRAFTLKDGRKYAGGTVGQTQRGQIQDAYRPDWVWFEDIEDASTIRSMTQTQKIISKVDEAIQGISQDGNYVVTANYISEEGTVEWFKHKKDISVQITPIIKDDEPTWQVFTREKIEKIRNDAENWEGDYLCDPTSGHDKFFAIETVKEAMKHTQDPLRVVAGVKIWKDYQSHHRYAIGGDTAEGVGRDANALALFDFTEGSVIGTYHNNEIEPDLFGYEMARLGRIYGDCLVAPEVNNTGHATIAALKNDNYTNIYKEVNRHKITNKRTEKLGWNTNRHTKPTMWFDFKRDFEDGLIKIYDAELLTEMLHYTKADFNERSQGIITRHFDLLTSAVIGWQMKNEFRAKSGLQVTIL